MLSMKQMGWRAETYGEYRDRVARVIATILDFRGGPMRHAELAYGSGFSEHHFARIFRGVVGESLMDLARRVRLERAAFRLRESDQTVSQIGFEAGYETLEAFGRSFKSTYGATPTSFRRQRGHIPLLPSPSGVHWRPQGVQVPPLPVDGRRTMLQAKTIRFGAKRIGYLRHVGETPGIDRSWARLQPMLAERGLSGPETRYFTRCIDDPDVVAPDQMRYDLCFTVQAEFQPFGEIEEDELPAGEYAVFLHQGDDDLIVDTWARAFSEWLPQCGREYDGLAFEEYVNGFFLKPAEPDEPLIVTAVYLKLRA